MLHTGIPPFEKWLQASFSNPDPILIQLPRLFCNSSLNEKSNLPWETLGGRNWAVIRQKIDDVSPEQKSSFFSPIIIVIRSDLRSGCYVTGCSQQMEGYCLIMWSVAKEPLHLQYVSVMCLQLFCSHCCLQCQLLVASNIVYVLQWPLEQHSWYLYQPVPLKTVTNHLWEMNLLYLSDNTMVKGGQF